jgi:hypothetical protein
MVVAVVKTDEEGEEEANEEAGGKGAVTASGVRR